MRKGAVENWCMWRNGNIANKNSAHTLKLCISTEKLVTPREVKGIKTTLEKRKKNGYLRILGLKKENQTVTTKAIFKSVWSHEEGGNSCFMATEGHTPAMILRGNNK